MAADGVEVDGAVAAGGPRLSSAGWLRARCLPLPITGMAMVLTTADTATALTTAAMAMALAGTAIVLTMGMATVPTTGMAIVLTTVIAIVTTGMAMVHTSARLEDYRAEPRVGGRRDLHPGGVRLPLSGGDIDWASRAVLAWRLSNTNDASFCAAALEEALLRFGTPRIFNTDQGSTFTAEAFAGKLAATGVAISMDGRGRFMDNIFIERLWRSIKYEEVHLKAYADGREARAGIGSWMTFYNFRRPHQAMNNQMPMAVWRAGMDKIEAAARAVDMPLRLDNANALPTYPQQKQQEAA